MTAFQDVKFLFLYKKNIHIFKPQKYQLFLKSSSNLQRMGELINFLFWHIFAARD